MLEYPATLLPLTLARLQLGREQHLPAASPLLRSSDCLTTLHMVCILPPCLSCSQVGNGNCDAGQQPVNRRQCNATPCEVTAGGLNTSFTEWGLCSASCGSGFAARTAFCRNPEGDLADLEMCSDYSGGCRAPL